MGKRKVLRTEREGYIFLMKFLKKVTVLENTRKNTKVRNIKKAPQDVLLFGG